MPSTEHLNTTMGCQKFNRPVLYAHRGSTVLAPENTAAAFDVALAYGADVLHGDTRRATRTHDQRTRPSA